MSYSHLQQRLADDGVNPVHAKALFGAIHRKLATELSEEANLLAPVQRWLTKESTPKLCQLEQVDATPSADGWTNKFLLQLEDGAEVESVLMGFPGRFTACLSTQVGCAMGCVFCATGQMGFSRHLSAGEIVAQAQHVQRHLMHTHGEKLRNIVMMGMGEPMHNFDATMEALDIITDTAGMKIAQPRVAVSTVGHVDGILKLARHPKRYSLAVSLHGSSNEERGKIMPINRKWPLDQLLDACREYSEIKRAKVFFAWTLIDGVNDSLDHAHQLAGLLKGMHAHVNLIPLNPTDDFSGKAPSAEKIDAFQQVLIDAGLPSTVRQRRGIDVAAGCGQLKAKRKKSS